MLLTYTLVVFLLFLVFIFIFSLILIPMRATYYTLLFLLTQLITAYISHLAYVRNVVNFSMCTSLDKCAISCWTPEVSVPAMA